MYYKLDVWCERGRGNTRYSFVRAGESVEGANVSFDGDLYKQIAGVEWAIPLVAFLVIIFGHIRKINDQKIVRLHVNYLNV